MANKTGIERNRYAVAARPSAWFDSGAPVVEITPWAGVLGTGQFSNSNTTAPTDPFRSKRTMDARSAGPWGKVGSGRLMNTAYHPSART